MVEFQERTGGINLALSLRLIICEMALWVPLGRFVPVGVIIVRKPVRHIDQFVLLHFPLIRTLEYSTGISVEVKFFRDGSQFASSRVHTPRLKQATVQQRAVRSEQTPGI